MSYLIDTNVISELRKRERAHPTVLHWYEGLDDNDLFLSVLVLGELRKGVEKARAKEPAKSLLFERWLLDVSRGFEGRILGIDAETAELWGRWSAERSLPVIDSLLAATATVHDLILVTRNIRHVEGLGARVLNPFEPA